MRARRDAALRLLKTMLAASLVIPLALFSYAGWLNYQSAFAHTDEQLTASLNILSEQASKIFQSVDLTLSSVDAILGDLTDEQIKERQEALHQQFSKLEKALATVDAIFVADKNGRALVSSSIYPLAPTQALPTAIIFEHNRNAMPALMWERASGRVRQEAIFSA